MNGANKRFMSGKTVWLQSHLIVYNVARGTMGDPFGQGLGTVGAELQTYDFDLRKIGGIQLSNGNAGEEFELRGLTDVNPNTTRNVTGSTRAIVAYFLPWGGQKTYCGKLGNNAKYFFTPTLNGCTFTYSDNGPNPSVAHSNFVDLNSQQADQTAMDNDLNNKFGGQAPANKIVKTDYKRVPTGGEDYRATVIGIRTGNSWDFYYQNYKVENQDLGTQGVVTLRTGLNLCVPI